MVSTIIFRYAPANDQIEINYLEADGSREVVFRNFNELGELIKGWVEQGFSFSAEGPMEIIMMFVNQQPVA